MYVQNNSHRTCLSSKVFNSVPDPTSFGFQSSRRQGYMQRLYFEYLYTQKVKGTTYFYTLTYNNKSIPQYMGYNVFSYEDIRLVTNGVISKTLERNYGSRLRYFCACESGEGKGTRGIGNNPHYHFIFFVQPLHDSKGNPVYDNYKVIEPIEFRRLVRKVWQGYDYATDPNIAIKGIVKEGDNCGLVRGVAAFKYVGKYVNKDATQLRIESALYDYFVAECKRKGIDMNVLYFFYKCSNYTSSDDKYAWHRFYEWLGLKSYNLYRHKTTDPDKSYVHWVTRYCDDLDVKCAALVANTFFLDTYVHMYPKCQLREYVNKYSGKVRCSKSLGEYGLNYVQDVEHYPLFKIPDPNGFDLQQITTYYYRKLYYKQIKCDVTGNVLYRLNDLGIKMKCNSLQHSIQSRVQSVSDCLSIVFDNKFLEFQRFRSNKLLASLNSSSDRENLIYKFSVYKCIYQFRHYSIFDNIFLSSDFSFTSISSDYFNFIHSDSFFFDYETSTVLRKLSRSNGEYLSFDSHPAIEPYIDTFRALDNMLDAVYSYRSDVSKRLFEEHKGVAKRVNASLFNQ